MRFKAPHASKLIDKIKMQIFDIYCQNGQAKDAIEFMKEKFTPRWISENQIELYSEIDSFFHQ